jgi:citrate lyase subunit beta / citryl-CoA lyase
MTITPRRSVLYMPGANERALEKAKSIAADALILDLEDAVAPEAKDVARKQVAAAVSRGGYGRRELVVRINGLDTPWGHEDVEMAASASPHGLLIPKVETPDDIAAVARIFSQAGGSERTQLWVMIEKPAAILNAKDIAAAKPTCFVLGTNDLIKETRASSENSRFALLGWISTVVLAARAYGVDVVDGVYNDFKDEAGFRAECDQGRLMGMDGKTLIHPSQVAICNEIFSPLPADIAWASRIIESFGLPENAAKGVITIDGRMVERLHLSMAERLVALVEAIAHG